MSQVKRFFCSRDCSSEGFYKRVGQMTTDVSIVAWGKGSGGTPYL
jgi:hypothetical protein